MSCFFCDKEAGSEGLHEVMTVQVEYVRGNVL